MQLRRDGLPTLHVAVDGPPDAPAVVLLHGITSSHRAWDWLVPELVATHLVVRPDARGHGQSERAPGTYDLFAYTDDAVAVIEEIGPPVVLVGHSLGGATAAAVAQRRPDLVRALLLEDPALLVARPADGSDIDVFRQGREHLRRVQAERPTEQELARRLAEEPTPFGVPAGERYEVDSFAGRAYGQLHVDVSVLDDVIDPPPDHLGAAFDIDAGVTPPTVVLAADPAAPDGATSSEDERRFTASSPSATWTGLPEGGHMLHDEKDHRPAVAAAVRGLVERVGAEEG